MTLPGSRPSIGPARVVRVVTLHGVPTLGTFAAGIFATHGWLIGVGIGLEAVVSIVVWGPRLLMDWSDAVRYVRTQSPDRQRPDTGNNGTSVIILNARGRPGHEQGDSTQADARPSP